MQILSSLLLLAGIAAAAAPNRNKSAGKCESDADCKAYPGTVCIIVNNGDYTTGKCTPNYGTRPVCRGGQSGLCPQYQTTTVGYLNAQCVLVDKATQAEATVDPTTVRRRLASNATTTTTGSSGNDTSGSLMAITPVKSQACPGNPGISLSDPDCWFTTTFKGKSLTVQYKCIAYDMCLTQSAWAKGTWQEQQAYCHPKNCATGTQQLCNNQGTCQGNDAYNPMSPTGYSCRCYAGFTGKYCEKSTGSKECDVDCGLGGACINRQCVCYNGYIGKDPRCLKCTSNDACENSATCNPVSGMCDCKPGFTGPTCGGKLTTCAGVKCSHGGYLGSTAGVCKCLCPSCPAGTACIQCGGANGTDCSTCPASGSSSGSSLNASSSTNGTTDVASDNAMSTLSFMALAISTLLVMAL